MLVYVLATFRLNGKLCVYTIVTGFWTIAYNIL